MRMFRRLLRDQAGATAIEFALIGPALIAMFLAVLQFGIGMQNYNSMRSISADVARFAVVNYQTGNKLSNDQLQNFARSTATTAPYNLVGTRFDVTIANANIQRVTGATEKTISMTYTIPTMIGFIGLKDIPLTFSRPVFLVSS